MDEIRCNIEEYYSTPSGALSWFPESWAVDEAAAIKVLQGIDPDHEDVSAEEFLATRVFGRVSGAGTDDVDFWVCKPTHPHAALYWQLERDPDAERADSVMGLAVPGTVDEGTVDEGTAARAATFKRQFRQLSKAAKK